MYLVKADGQISTTTIQVIGVYYALMQAHY